MGIKFYFNKSAWSDLAKELRRASWGVSVLFGAGGYNLSNMWILVFGCISWGVLQTIALLLVSVINDKESSK